MFNNKILLKKKHLFEYQNLRYHLLLDHDIKLEFILNKRCRL